MPVEERAKGYVNYDTYLAKARTATSDAEMATKVVTAGDDKWSREMFHPGSTKSARLATWQPLIRLTVVILQVPVFRGIIMPCTIKVRFHVCGQMKAFYTRAQSIRL